MNAIPRIRASGDCTAMCVRRLARRVTQIYDEALAPHGLTIGQLGILANLRRSQPIGIAALAERLSTDASTVSRLLKPLVSAELIAVDANPDDRRAKALRLTEIGYARRRKAVPAWLAAQDGVTDRLGAKRLTALRDAVNDAFAQL